MRPISALVLFFLIGAPVGGQESPDSTAIVDLERFVGRWHTTASGDSSGVRFTYQLAWFDRDRTVAKMLIGMIRDGAETLLWEGFKGWDPTRRESFYYGFDTSGRQARGVVFSSGDSSVTAYRGRTPAGQLLEIRDVSVFVADGRWRAITYVRPSADEAWREVRRDDYVRVPGS